MSSDISKDNQIPAFLLPFIGIFTAFKYVFLVLFDIILYALKGIKFIFLDIFVITINKIMNKDAIKTMSQEEIIENQATISNKQASIYSNLWFIKKRQEKLEMMRANLIAELQNTEATRSSTPKIYWYKAKTSEGKMETGTINGYSKLDVNTFLLQEGYTVYDIRSDKKIDFLYGEGSFFTVKMSTKDLLFWLTQLSTYIKAGISLTDGVRILNNQFKNKPRYRKAFQSIIYELTMGANFSSALEKQGSMFPALLINMIKAAEATGDLESTLAEMANYYEEVNKTHKQMISAIMYPAVVSVFAFLVICFILIYVIPEFVKIYEESDAKITGITLIVINLSKFLKANFLYVVVIIAVTIFILYMCYKYVKAFRKNMQKFIMHLPFFGNIIIYSELTIFTKTFASLLANNVFITDSMNILSKITNNEIYKDIMQNTISNIIKGEKISSSFKDHWAIPEVAYYMLVTGESTGQLADMMDKVSAYYSEMHKSLVSNLKAFVEPILIVILAFIVGLIIIAVIVPMFELMNQIDV